MATKFKVPDFVPIDAEAQAIQADVDKATQDKEDAKTTEKDEEAKEEEDPAKKKKEEEAAKKQEEDAAKDEASKQEEAPDDWEKLKKEFLEIYKELGAPEGTKALEDTVIKAEEFEKDDDSNYHIDYMHAMANSRAATYKLEPMDWLQVKLKAGRIVPAMATTTAAIAGLQALELVKLARGTKKADHRNAFLNLAVPIMQASEPDRKSVV